MATLNPDHLFKQAEQLIVAPAAGPPRQVDLRRAISAAYYGLFHHTMIELGDEFVGRTRRNTPQYELVYRSVDHRSFRQLCDDISKVTPPARYGRYLTDAGLGSRGQAYAAAVSDLQQRRHRADYDPTPRFRTADAQLAIDTARGAIRRYNRAGAVRRRAFLTLLLCPPRTP